MDLQTVHLMDSQMDLPTEYQMDLPTVYLMDSQMDLPMSLRKAVQTE